MSRQEASQEAPPATLGERAGARAAALAAAAAARLPHARALALAGAAGRAWVRLGLPRTDTGLRNLRIAFPEWSERRRRDVLAAAFANLARTGVEFATFSRRDAVALHALADVEGVEHLEAAVRSSKTGGVVILTGHYGSWELLVALMAARDYPLVVVHRARDNPAFGALVDGWRDESGAEMLPRGSAARAALRALAAGKMLAMPLDQNCDPDEGVFVPFLGRLAATRDGPTRIAMRTGAPVVPVFIERIGESERHRVRMEPAVELLPEGSDRNAAVRENVRRMLAPIEAAIRRAPENWIWNHRRFGSQPPGEAQPYPSRRRRRPVA